MDPHTTSTTPMEPFTMKLQGEAIIPKIAERAIMEVGVSAEDANRQKASDLVISTAKKLQGFLKTQSETIDPSLTEGESQAQTTNTSNAAIAKWSMGKLTTSTRFNHTWQNNMSVVDRNNPIYTAKVQFTIRVRDFAKLSTLASVFAREQHVSVNRTSWILTAQTRKAYQSELRRLAAADALQKAKEYAEALGLAKVRPVSLVELPEKGSYYPQQQQMQMQQHSAPPPPPGAGGDDDGVDLIYEPDEIQLSMKIECKFAAE